MLPNLTEKLRASADLTAAEIAAACEALLDESISLPARADFLRALHVKGETPAEIAGFVNALLERANPADLGAGVLDVCGTGGDRAGLFNVSTAVMFVAAACGARIVKHGNRGITSKCGGADVLEALGIRLDLPPGEALEAAGCCFLFAPLYHPSFKAIGPVRKALAEEGSATVFNMLGPLLNPARPDYQLAGVFNEALLPAYAEVFALLGRRRAWAAHGAGGLDEISTLGLSHIYSVDEDERSTFYLDPAAFGLPSTSAEDLRGGDAAANGRTIEELLAGTLQGPKHDIVTLNAACALVVAGIVDTPEKGFALATEAMDSGDALAPLRALQELSAGN